MVRLHSNRGYLYLFIFIASIATVHLISHLVSGSTPQILAHLTDPEHNTLLDEMYNRGNPITYVLRNLTVAYSVYPMLLFTFLTDHFHKDRWLRFLSWKVLLVFFVSVGTIVTLLGEPRLVIGEGIYGFVCSNIVFTTGGGFYIFAIINWIIFAVLSFHILQKKTPKHHALWLALLLFLSVEEVWEYAPFIWAYRVHPHPILLPLNLLVTLHLWRATPSILLIFYTYKYGFNQNKKLFLASLTTSLTLSLHLILKPDSYKLSPFLRIAWAITYLLYAHSLNYGAVKVREVTR